MDLAYMTRITGRYIRTHYHRKPQPHLQEAPARPAVGAQQAGGARPAVVRLAVLSRRFQIQPEGALQQPLRGRSAGFGSDLDRRR